MAYFKISLLTPRFENNSTIFIEDIITEFFTQRSEYKSKQEDLILQDGVILSVQNKEIASRKNIVINTYNEKFSKSQNAQKTLSFDLDKYIIKANERYENPFANNISVGTQILLTDQYSNEYLFTVSEIKYTFKENNITYNITCQDSFSYQMTRQQNGYTIENDIESEDFIGAKTLDWWVINKIVPECYLSSYNYLSCEDGLYEAIDGSYKTFKYYQDLNDVKRIIKDAHRPPVYKNGEIQEENDIDYFETFPFSCSGSNVDAALIALGEEVKMQINTFEHAKITDSKRTKYFDKYFWFEPTKNTKRIGLKYSPTHNIQSFNLTHNGQSLTTILNVEGPTYDDELITLLPTIPSFFHQYFQSVEWQESKYTSGFFSGLCKNQQYISIVNDEQIATPENYWFILDLKNATKAKLTGGDVSLISIRIPIINGKIWNKETEIFDDIFKRKALYDFFNFFGETKEDTEQISGISVKYKLTNQEEEYKYHYSTPRSDVWTLCYEDQEGIIHEFQQDIDEIDKDVLEEQFFIQIKTVLEETSSTVIDVNEDTIALEDARAYLKFYRDFSEEDLDFARIADACPWLENKLIDFSYFKDINIISNEEYSSLIDILYNDLRIVNGKLMFYAQSYYESMRKRTEILAQLTNDLDSLGASCQAAIIDPITQSGATKDISYFENAYKNVWTKPEKPTPIVGYNDLLNEYLYKYQNAKQRFLKNIYYFRKYFNEVNLLNNKDLYKYTLKISNNDLSDMEKTFYSFKQGKFVSIKSNYNYYSGYRSVADDTTVKDYGKCLIPIFSGEYGSLYPVKVASKDMWEQELFLAPFLFGKDFYCDPILGRGSYNTSAEYIKPIFLIPVSMGIEDEKEYFYLTGDDNNNYRIIEYSLINATTKTEYTKNLGYSDYTNPATKAWPGTYRLNITKNGKSKSYICKTIGRYQEKIDGTEHFYIKLQPIVYSNDLLDDLNLIYNSTDIEKLQNINASDFTLSAIYAKWTDKEKLATANSHSYEDPIWSCFIQYPEGSTEEEDTRDYLSIKGEEVSFSEMVNNYLLSQTSAPQDQPYTKITNFYTQFDDSSFAKAIRLLETYINSMYIASKVDDRWFKEDKKDDELKWEAKIQYYAYIPLTELYHEGPKYRITQSDRLYKIERVNLKNQTFNDYINYVDKIHARNANDEKTHIAEVINPYDSSQTSYQKVDFVSPTNSSKFFRRVRWSGVDLGFTIGTAVLINPLVGLISAMFSQFTNPIEAENTAVYSNTDIFNNKISSPKSGFNDYKYWEPPDDNKKHKNPFFVANKDSYNLYNDYKSSLYSDVFLNFLFLGKRTLTLDQFNNYNGRIPLTFAKYNYNEDSNSDDSDDDGPTVDITYSQEAYKEYFKHYFFGFTYENLDSNFYYKEAYYKPCRINDLVIKNKMYGLLKIHKGITSPTDDTANESILIPGKELDWEHLEKDLLGKRLSTVVYYPITKLIQPLDISGVKKSDEMTIQALLEQIGIKDITNVQYGENSHTSYIFSCKVSDDTETYYCILYEYRNYKESYVYDYLQYNDIVKNYSATKYLNQIGDYYDFSQIQDIAKGYYILPDIKKDKIHANANPEIGGEDDFDMWSTYYDIDGNRIYTIKQLKSSNKQYYYFTGVPLEIEDFTSQQYEFNVDLYRSVPIWEGISYLKTIKQEKVDEITKITFKPLFNEGKNSLIGTASVAIGDEKVEFELYRELKESIQNITNGHFWSKFKDRLDQPILLQQAAAIEAQLTLYWEQAYTASKYCEYFLPETWTLSNNQCTNYFFNKIITFNDILETHTRVIDDKTQTYTIVVDSEPILSNQLLPDVKIYKDSDRNSVLPKYKFTRIDSLNYTIDKINQMDFTPASTLLDNVAIADIFEQLEEDPSDWYAEKIGETTYYYTTTGGMTWVDLFNKVLNKGSSFQEMSGLYVMLYKLLKENYLTLDCSMYNELMNQHNAIWNKIYKNYGFLMLENSYKNDTATTSKDLLKMAQLYFKDKQNPERGYNIAVIDTASLENYDGVEIRIGDGIQVDAKQYYNEYDKVYNSLSQYLFITDLNYILRDTSNINLTVNSIKYEEGIVKRLAKLIK